MIIFRAFGFPLFPLYFYTIMTFAYRLKLYGFGFIIGLFILAIILKGKQCSGPSVLKIQELYTQRIVLSDKAKCQLNCLGMNETSFVQALYKCRVNYDKTEVHATPCGKYFVEGINKDSLGFTAFILDCDSLSKVEELNILKPSVSCDCK